MSMVLATEPSSGEQLDFSGRVCGDLNALDDFASELDREAEGRQLAGSSSSRRINANPGTIEKDLARLVLAVIDTVRRLMERQAARRVNAGTLSEEQVEEMGETFLRLDQKMAELTSAFGLQPEDLDLNLGPVVDRL